MDRITQFLKATVASYTFVLAVFIEECYQMFLKKMVRYRQLWTKIVASTGTGIIIKTIVNYKLFF